MPQRTRRTVRAKSRHNLRLAERDLWLLEGLAKMRFLATSQIAKLYFNSSRWYPNKRLRNLLNAGLVKTWVRNLAEENIYSITRSGLAVIESRSATFRPMKLPYRLDENLAHLLAINDVRTALAVTLAEIGGEIVWWRSDWELRSHGRDRIIPDGLFLINWNGVKDQAYALEIDNNTRSSKNFLKKILAYGSAQTMAKGIYGVSDPIILVAGSEAKWVQRYRTAVKQLRLNHRIWFTATDEIKVSGAAGAVWANEGEKKYSLRELTFCPYGKDTSHEQTSSG